MTTTTTTKQYEKISAQFICSRFKSARKFIQKNPKARKFRARLEQIVVK